MAQPNPPNPANLKVKFATFKGKSKKADPDAHVSQFGTKWEASGLGALYGDDVKKQQFAATLEGKAMNWYTHYGAAHFPDTAALETAFLARFRKEKTPTDILKKIRKMKQKSLLVEDYAQKMLDLAGRLGANDRPTNETLSEYFCKGLRRNLRTAVASNDIAAGVGGFNDFVAAARRAEKRLGTSKSSKKKKSSRQDSDSETDAESY